MTGVAVVFDSAGTLLHMCRAAKDLRDGTMLYDIVTTELAHENPNYGIVILIIEPDMLLQIDKDQPIHQLLNEYHIKIHKY